MLNFCDFIQVFVFTRNHHLKIMGKSSHTEFICSLYWICQRHQSPPINLVSWAKSIYPFIPKSKTMLYEIYFGHRDCCR